MFTPEQPENMNAARRNRKNWGLSRSAESFGLSARSSGPFTPGRSSTPSSPRRLSPQAAATNRNRAYPGSSSMASPAPWTPAAKPMVPRT